MKIINKSQYDTKGLKRLFIAACKFHYGNEPRKWKYTKIYVKDAISGGGGQATIGGNWIELRLRKPEINGFGELAISDSRKRCMAWLFIHEKIHNDGISGHWNYPKYFKSWTDVNDDYERLNFADIIKVGITPIKEKTVKPKRDLQLRRYDKAMKLVSKYEKIVRQKSVLLKKWKQKQRYYERTLVAAGKLEGKGL